MATTSAITTNLIAPCGMNCGLCMAYLREKKKCDGCRGKDESKAPSCLHCIIKNCTKRKGNYCFSCNTYPCTRLKKLDKRYRTKYHMSMLENLENIKILGIRTFINNEKIRWRCPGCNGVICVHRGYCFNCGKKKEYRSYEQ